MLLRELHMYTVAEALTPYRPSRPWPCEPADPFSPRKPVQPPCSPSPPLPFPTSLQRGKRRAVARRRSRSRSVSRERRGSTVRERRDKRPQTAWTEPASGDDGDAATAAAPAAALPAPAPASSALPPLTRIQLRPETARLPSDKTESFLHGYGATGESDTEENEEGETTAPPRGRSPSRFNNSLLRTVCTCTHTHTHIPLRFNMHHPL